MPWINDEAQFPTPINATFTVGMFGYLAWHLYLLWGYKKLRGEKPLKRVGDAWGLRVVSSAFSIVPYIWVLGGYVGGTACSAVTPSPFLKH